MQSSNPRQLVHRQLKARLSLAQLWRRWRAHETTDQSHNAPEDFFSGSSCSSMVIINLPPVLVLPGLAYRLGRHSFHGHRFPELS